MARFKSTPLLSKTVTERRVQRRNASRAGDGLCLLATAIMLTAFGPAPSSSANPVDTAFPKSLTVFTAAGQPVDLSRKPGWKVIYFWSSVCPCVKACEKYSFVPLSRKYQGTVSFFAVDSDGWDLQMPNGQLDSYIRQHVLPYPVYIDTAHAAALSLHAQVTPEAFVIGPNGKVVFAGMPDDSRRYLFSPPTAASKRPTPVPKTFLATALAEGLAGLPITPSPIPLAGCVVAW